MSAAPVSKDGVTDGLIASGAPSSGYHASGFPIYRDMPSSSGGAAIAGGATAAGGGAAGAAGGAQGKSEGAAGERKKERLRMPTGMIYSTEGVYDNLPPQRPEQYRREF